MQLTKHTDFALRTLLYLAVIPEGKKSSVRELSDKFMMSYHHIAKVVHELGKNGIIKTTKGNRGGIELSLKAEEIKVGHIIRLMEETLDPINCNDPPCPLSGMCSAKGDLNKAMQLFLEYLDGITIADWLKGEAKDVLIDIALKE